MGAEIFGPGRHYWETQIVCENTSHLYVGVCTPDASETWLIHALDGALWGNEHFTSHHASEGFEQGDRVGMLLDVDDGSLAFYKNGEENSPSFTVGSVALPVVAAVHMMHVGHAVRIVPAHVPACIDDD